MLIKNIALQNEDKFNFDRIICYAKQIFAKFSTIISFYFQTKLTVPDEFSIYLVLEPAKGDLKDFDNDAELAKWRWRVQKLDMLVPEYEYGSGIGSKIEKHNLQLMDFCNFSLAHKIDVS